jgi:hypothetical protein
MPSYIVGVYWGAREESREDCAARISAFLIALAKHDVALSKWFKKMYSRKQPLVQVPMTPVGLTPLLGVNRRDIDREIIRELGFDFSAWDGRDDEIGASLSVACGAYTSVVPNSAVVSFDPQAAPALDLLRGILRSTVAAFDPENGVVTTIESARAHGVSRIWEAPALYRYRRGSGFSEG